MGKSFVLKDAAGRPGGYLMQGIREICFRAGDAAQPLQAVLLFEGGAQEEHEADGGWEMHWPCEGRVLCGGYVCAEGRLLLSTGEEARCAFAHHTLHKRTAREKGQTESAAEPARKQEEPGHAQQAREWPQRRWPPPPCWPQASYAQGRWQERMS